MHFVLIGSAVPALAMTPAGPYTIPGPTIGNAFSFNMTITGGVAPYSVTTSGGNGLPPGLSMNAATGAITGTPTTAGYYAWNVVVNDSVGNSAASININTSVYTAMVANPGSSALTARTSGTAFSQVLTTSGGSGGYTYAIVSGSLPPGVVLDPNGTISGTPSGPTTYAFTVRRTDNTGHILDTYYTITIIASGPTVGVPHTDGVALDSIVYYGGWPGYTLESGINAAQLLHDVPFATSFGVTTFSPGLYDVHYVDTGATRTDFISDGNGGGYNQTYNLYNIYFTRIS